MSDLPPAVEEYFRKRDKDPAKLDKIPKTKKAFKDLSQAQLDALDMLDELGEALEKDLKDGNHIGKGEEADVTPGQKVQTYTYAIH
jgi:hypothetical protein